MREPKILISIVTYNTNSEVLKECLSKITHIKNIYLSIFDNSKSKDIKNIAFNLSINYFSSKNIGFGSGHNKNIALFLNKNKGIDYVLILNPDVYMNAQNVFDLVNSLNRNKKAIILSPLLLNSDNTVQNFIRTFPTFADFLLRFFNFKQVNFAENIKKITAVPFAHGACYLLRKHDFLKFMGFDERFFLYCEDLDFCRRVYESGNIVLVNPDIKVNHLFQRQSR